MAEMEEKFAAVGKDVLVEIVKLVQKQRLRGKKGGWKEFLNFYDKKIGDGLSDPTKRSPDVLLAFLKTFKEERDLKLFERVMKCYSRRQVAKQLLASQDSESPEQRLVHLTFEHPQYPIEYSFPSDEKGWIVTELKKKHKLKNSMLAVDCEMVECEDGTDALVKICVVDRDLQIQLHEFVNPGKAVANYRTSITGVSAEDLDGVSCSLVDVQKSMKKLLSRGAILVGHSLSNDLKALKIDHARVIDTSYIYRFSDDSVKRRPSLNDLCKFVLGHEVRKNGDPHNCVDDASAAMKLVLAKIKPGCNDIIPEDKDDVPKDELAKLLVHRIPTSFPSEELHRYIPGDFTLEIQPNKKGKGDKYTALAIFKDPQEALQAYENVEGNEQKDSFGRAQKSFYIKLSSGLTKAICIRKMACDDLTEVLTKKRPPTEELLTESKMLKVDLKIQESEQNSCPNHVEEIERLKNLLSQRDQEITSLHKIIAALTRKQGL